MKASVSKFSRIYGNLTHLLPGGALVQQQKHTNTSCSRAVNTDLYTQIVEKQTRKLVWEGEGCKNGNEVTGVHNNQAQYDKIIYIWKKKKRSACILTSSRKCKLAWCEREIMFEVASGQHVISPLSQFKSPVIWQTSVHQDVCTAVYTLMSQ